MMNSPGILIDSLFLSFFEKMVWKKSPTLFLKEDFLGST